MTHLFEQPMLSLSTHTIDGIRDLGVDDLSAMWTVFTKCKAHLENGRRLENMSWRLWYHEKQSTSLDYFSYIAPTSQSTCSSTTTASSTSSHGNSLNSSLKRFISSLDHCAWSHAATKGSDSGSTESHDDANRQIRESQVQETNQVVSADTAIGSTENTHCNQPLGKDTHTHLENQDCNDTNGNHSGNLDDRMNLDDDDTYCLDDQDDDFHRDEDDDDIDSFDCDFIKTQPQPPATRPSLLSALIQQQTNPSSNSSAIQRQQSSTGSPHPTGPGQPVQAAPRDHYLRKELTESLRRSILWEHIQQQNLVYRKQTSMYRRQSLRSQKPQTEMTTSGWLESFRGW